MTKFHCGIDFGTTNSSLAISSTSTPSLIPIDNLNSNPAVLRSLIYVNPSQKITVGYDAINHYLTDLQNLPSKPLRQEYTGRMIKVMVPTGSGTMKADFISEMIEVDDSGRGRLLQSLKSVLTSSVFTGTTIFGKFYNLVDLLTILLKEIKTRAETEVGHELISAVIGRPVRYVGQEENKIALDRMHQIAINAGFKNIEFEYEPVGAALNYGKDIKVDQNIMVFDFGGGTLDICIMKFPSKEITAVSGRGIGGDLLDSQLVKTSLLHQFGADSIINGRLPLPRHFFSAFDSWYQTTLQKNMKNIEALRKYTIESDSPQLIKNLTNLILHDYGFEFFRSIDNAKIALTNSDIFDFYFHQPHLSIKQKLTRSGFEEAIESEVEESKKCIFESLHQAAIKPDQIDKVILTGGSSQIPIFIQMISNIFTPDKLIHTNHFTSVAAGLSLRAEEIFN